MGRRDATSGLVGVAIVAPNGPPAATTVPTETPTVASLPAGLRVEVVGDSHVVARRGVVTSTFGALLPGGLDLLALSVGLLAP